MESKAVSRKTLREHVYEALRAEIISGDIFPGQSLTLKSLSTQFGVSIVPVREALFQLSSEGVVVQRSNRDYRVATLSPEEFTETYRIRNLIEPYLAERAFRFRPEEAHTHLKAILNCMRESLGNPKEYIRCNQQFHFALYSYGKMPVLMGIIRGLWARIGPYLSIHIELLEDLTVSHHFHETMLRSFVTGDFDTFNRQLRCDIHESYRALSPLVKELDAEGGVTTREAIVARTLATRPRPRGTSETPVSASLENEAPENVEWKR